MSGGIDLETLNGAIQRWGHRVETLAIRTNMPVATLQRKLAGETDFCVGELMRVCHTVGLNPSELVQETEPVKKDKSLTPRVRDLEASEEMRMWAALNLDHLGERIIFDQDRKVKVREAEDGLIYRGAFRITVSPGHLPDFVIRLYRGASTNDLMCARRIIAQAKEGKFSLKDWTRVEKFTNQDCGGYIMRLWFESSGKPHTDELRECDDAACVEPFHGWMREMQDSPCRTEATEHPSGVYTVRGWKYHGEEWAAYVDHDSECFPEGPEGLKVVRDLANDYAWVQAECDRLNAEDHLRGAPTMLQLVSEFESKMGAHVEQRR